MKVIIQSKNSHLYWTDRGGWVQTINDALVFPNSASALNYCLRNKLAEWDVLLKFENPRYDILLPGTAFKIPSRPSAN